MTDHPFVVALAAIIVITVYPAWLNIKIAKLKAQIKKPPPPAQPQPSQELSDFLNDTKTGYSFVRVSPSDVIIRSPRG